MRLRNKIVLGKRRDGSVQNENSPHFAGQLKVKVCVCTGLCVFSFVFCYVDRQTNVGSLVT